MRHSISRSGVPDRGWITRMVDGIYHCSPSEESVANRRRYSTLHILMISHDEASVDGTLTQGLPLSECSNEIASLIAPLKEPRRVGGKNAGGVSELANGPEVVDE